MCTDISAAVTVNCMADISQPVATYSFTLDIIVTATNPPAGEDIVVSFNGTEVARSAPDASGTTTFTAVAVTEGPSFGNELLVEFDNTPTCVDNQLIDLNACTAVCPGGTDQVGGNVFVDANGDGADAGAMEVGQANVLVRVYDCAEMLVCEVLTNADGNWSCDGLTDREDYRVEFSTPLQPGLIPSNAGVDNGSNVQFVQPRNCDVDYGVVDPRICIEEDRSFVTTCFSIGNPNQSKYVNDGAVIGDPVTARDPFLTSGPGPIPHEDVWATIPQVGATYGVAIDERQQAIYAAAYLKRLAGFGPGNVGADGAIGAIYKMMPDGTVSVVVDLSPDNPGNSTGFNTGSNPHPNTTTMWPGGAMGNICDPAYHEIGRRGWGDIDVSEDGTQLYAVNMFDRALYVINVADGSIAGRYVIPGVTDLFGVANGPAWTQASCSNNPDLDLRPMGLGRRGNTLFVGIVCSAESTQNDQNLHAYVWPFDLTLNQYASAAIVDFGIGSNSDFSTNSGDGGYGYKSWAPLGSVPVNGINDINIPRPILADIDFIGDDILIGLRNIQKDRLAGEDGTFLPDGQGNCTNVEQTDGIGGGANGRILRACSVNGTLSIESGGSCGGVTGFGPNRQNNAGYATFYEQDVEHFGSDYTGSLAVDPNSEIILTTGTPGGEAGGVLFISGAPDFSYRLGPDLPNNSAEDRQFKQIYQFDFSATQNDVFAKATGTGDIELICDLDRDIQIGNYAWVDTDGDGLQDPCEPPLAGLTVKLYRKNSGDAGAPVLIATDTTDATGNYYFSSASAASTDADQTWLGTDGDTIVSADSTYFIAFCGDDGFDATTNTLSVDGQPLCLSPANMGQAAASNPTDGSADQNDSDATVQNVAGAMIPAYCTMAGELSNGPDHTFDAGFKPVCPLIILVSMPPSRCASATIGLSALIDSISSPAAFDYVWTTDGDGVFTDASGATVTAPASNAVATTYLPGPSDRSGGEVALTLEVLPADLPTGCPPATATVAITILDVDCGSFLWNGR